MSRGVPLLALVLAACVDRFAARQTIDLVARSLPAIEQDSDPDLVEAAAPGGILQLEGFYVAWGPDRQLETLLARATCGYAAGFLADRAEAADLDGDGHAARALATRARSLLGRCASWALLGLGGRYAGILDDSPGDAAATLARATPDDAELLYWLGTAVAASIGTTPDDLHIIALAPRATALLERAVALDDGVDHGRAHVVLGILYSAQSAAVGGDPARGRQHFEHALAISGGSLLLARVMLARYFAVTTRDAARFDRELAEVIATSPSRWPARRLDNELAHRKARRYLTHRDRWF